MAKLIKLPGGKYVKADAVISVGELWKEDHIDEWGYSICYLDNDGVKTFHVVKLAKNGFICNGERALAKQGNFVSNVNDNL
jgi:hypothetical protein